MTSPAPAGLFFAGQRAMAIAMLSPEAEGASERGKKGGRGKKAAISGGVSAAPQQRIADARAVLAYSPELAEAVMLGPFLLSKMFSFNPLRPCFFCVDFRA